MINSLLGKEIRLSPSSIVYSRRQSSPYLHLEDYSIILDFDFLQNAIAITADSDSRLFEVVPKCGLLLSFQPSTTTISNGFEDLLQPEMEW